MKVRQIGQHPIGPSVEKIADRLSAGSDTNHTGATSKTGFDVTAGVADEDCGVDQRVEAVT